MKVLVCGGRTFNDFKLLNSVLDDIHKYDTITTVISGNAPGADTLGETWAGLNSVARDVYPADWSNLNTKPLKVKTNKHGTYNAMAGFIRNNKMIVEGKPDLIVAFTGGKGTKHMIDLGIKAKIEIKMICD